MCNEIIMPHAGTMHAQTHKLSICPPASSRRQSQQQNYLLAATSATFYTGIVVTRSGVNAHTALHQSDVLNMSTCGPGHKHRKKPSKQLLSSLGGGRGGTMGSTRWRHCLALVFLLVLGLLSQKTLSISVEGMFGHFLRRL